jgi:mandelamide amidase
VSNAGIPGVTLPIGSSPEGLPIGLALDGPASSDRRLLAITAKRTENFAARPAPKGMP